MDYSSRLLVRSASQARYVIEQLGSEWLSDQRRDLSEDLFVYVVAKALPGSDFRQVEDLPVGQIEARVLSMILDMPSLTAEHARYTEMRVIKNRLHTRERNRREAIWALFYKEPGDPAAADSLAVIDRVAQEESEDPIGAGVGITSASLGELVPIREVSGRIPYVDERDIPEPWLERMIQASTGSTCPKGGFYAHDWRKFLRLWDEEAEKIACHRRARTELQIQYERTPLSDAQ